MGKTKRTNRKTSKIKKKSRSTRNNKRGKAASSTNTSRSKPNPNRANLTEKISRVYLKSERKTIYRADLERGRVEIPVMTQIKVEDLEDQDFRSEQDILLIIDKSGSMSGSKIQLVRKTINFMIDQLEENDRLGLIAFSSGVENLAGMTLMNEENKKKLKSIVSSRIYASGTTNVTAALRNGFHLLKNINKADVRDSTTVYFLSDGHATCGIRGAKLKKTMQDGLRSIAGIYSDIRFNSFGYGSGHDEKLLSEIANISKGKFYYVKEDKDLDRCVLDCFGNTISVCGKEVVAEINFPRGTKITEVYGGDISKLSNTRATIDIGNIIVGKNLNYLMRVSIKPTKKMLFKNELVIGEVQLKYELDGKIIQKNDILKMDIIEEIEEEGNADSEVVEEMEKQRGKTALEEARKIYLSKGEEQASQYIIKYFNAMSLNDDIGLDFKYAMLQNMAIDNVKNEKNYLQATLMFENNAFNPQFGNFSKQNTVQLKLNEKLNKRK